MIGNAAHTMTNFQQLGPSQDIEDAMILGAVLGKATASSAKSIDAALFAYDAVRRPRSQWVAGHGKRLGMMWTGMVEGVGIEVEKLRKEFLKWKEEGEKYDAGKHREEALSVMKERLEGGGKGRKGGGEQEVIEL